ncbi:MAG: hypothetical protein V9G98_21010 [Candidatus Competibacter sp.]
MSPSHDGIFFRPITGNDEVGFWVGGQHHRHSLDQDVHPFLHRHSTRREDDRCQRRDAVATLDLGGINETIESMIVDTVGDHMDLLGRNSINPVQFVGEKVADRNYQIGVVTASRLGVADPAGEPVKKDIAITTVLRGVHGQHTGRAEAVHRILHGVGGEPVVGMDDLELADHGSYFVKTMSHGFAHVIHALDIVFAQAMIDPVIVNPVDAVIVILTLLASGDDMQVVSSPLQAGGQFGDMDTEATRGDRVEGF